MENSEKFLVWLKNTDPFLFAVAKRAQQLKDQNVSLGLGGIADFLSTAISTVTSIAPKVMEYQQTKKLLDVQIARAKQNMPPLDTSQYQVTRPYDPNSQSQQQYIDQLARQSLNQQGYQTQTTSSFSQYMPLLLLASGGLLIYKLAKGSK